MTSILSAAGYSPPKPQRRKIPQQQQVQREKQQLLEESATKKALRKRALRHFHRSGSGSTVVGSGGVTVVGSGSEKKNVGKEKEGGNADANNNGGKSEEEVVGSRPDAANVNATYQSAPAPSKVVTPDNNHHLQSTTQQQQQQHSQQEKKTSVSNYSHSRPPTPPNQQQQHQQQQQQQTHHHKSPFFPRTSISPKSNPNNPTIYKMPDNNSSSYIPSPKSSSSSQQVVVVVDDPELQTYPSDIEAQSNATSGYNSGSDLESAARRILRGGKRGGRQTKRFERKMSSSSLSDTGDGTGDGKSVASSNVSSTVRTRKLPPGWRERIKRKTGMDVPTMASNTAANNSSRTVKQPGGYYEHVTKNEVMTATTTSGQDNEMMQHHDDDDDVHQHVASTLLDNNDESEETQQQQLPPRPGPSPTISEYDPEYYPEDLVNNGAFPNYERVEGLRKISAVDAGGLLPPSGLEGYDYIDDHNGQLLHHEHRNYYEDHNGGGEGGGGAKGDHKQGYGGHHPNMDWQQSHLGQQQSQYQLRHFSSTTENYEYNYNEVEEEYHHDANVELEQECGDGINNNNNIDNDDEEQYYYSHNNEWDPDSMDVGHSRDSWEGGEEGGDDNNNNNYNYANAHDNNRGGNTYVNGDDMAVGDKDGIGDRSNGEHRFIPIDIGEEEDGFPISPNTDDLKDFVPSSAPSAINNNERGSHLPPQAPVLDQQPNNLPSQPPTAEKRVQFSASVDGHPKNNDTANDHDDVDDSEEDGFNDDDDDAYFQHFYSEVAKMEEEEEATIMEEPQPDFAVAATAKDGAFWEEIPSSPMVQWKSSTSQSPSMSVSRANSSSRSKKQEGSNRQSPRRSNGFNSENQDEESAWSYSVSLATSTISGQSSTNTASGQSTSEKAEGDPFSSWREEEKKVSRPNHSQKGASPSRGSSIPRKEASPSRSIPQWKVRKINAQKHKTQMPENMAELNVMTDLKSVLNHHEPKKKDRPPRANNAQPLYVLCDEENEVKSRTCTPPRQQVRSPAHNNAFSDGDVSGYDTSDIEGGGASLTTPGRKSRRGLRFFHRSRSNNKKYNSEGEKSDTNSDWESSDDRRFSLSPLRGRRKKKKRSYKPSSRSLSLSKHGSSSRSPSRLRLFGGGQQKHHHQHLPSGEEEEVKVDEKYTRREHPWDKNSKSGQRTPTNVVKKEKYIGQSPVAGESNVVRANGAQSGGGNKSTVKAGNVVARKPEGGPIVQDFIAARNRAPSKSETDDTTTRNSNLNDSVVTDETLLNSHNLNESMETDTTPFSNTEDGGSMNRKLNDSNVTQSTIMASNAHSNNTKPSSNTAYPTNHEMKARPSISTPAGKDHAFGIEKSASKDSSHHSGTTIRTELRTDDDTISTLGSLITKETKGSKSIRSKLTNRPSLACDISTVTELSEIERLRKENDRLREELENASMFSSKVSSMYAESLKLENNRLREELENTSKLPITNVALGNSNYHLTREEQQQHRDPKYTMHKSTLETLLENDNKKRSPRARRRLSARQEAITDFNHLPPVAHLINGVDFDDDSITTYSPIGMESRPSVNFEQNVGCDTGPEILKKTCSRIATTTRTVASQVKNAAVDLNNERRNGGGDGSTFMTPMSRSLDCFNACSRRGGRMEEHSIKTSLTRKKSNASPKRNRRRRQAGASSRSKQMMISEETSTTGSLSEDDSFVHDNERKKSKKTRKKGKSRKKVTNPREFMDASSSAVIKPL